jgi:predicted dehydrogenase
MNKIKTENIGVAVIGLGVGAQHARAYYQTDCCELRWLYDLDSTKAASLAQDLGCGQVAANIEDILEDPAVQAVSIASYDDAHFSQVMLALEAGKHVFVEKPLCLSQNELRTIKSVWAKYQGRVKLASNLVLRAAPAYRYIKQRLEAGDLGEIYAFDGDYLYGRLDKITHGWRGHIKNYSVMLGGGVHLVDLMLWLTGQKPQEVWAVGNRISLRGTEFDFLDNVSATFVTPSEGLIGRITANFGCVHPHQHVVRLFGTKGTFLYDDQGPRLYMNRDPAVQAISLDLSALPPSKDALISDFVRTIVEGKDTRAQTQHEFDVINVCLATEQAVAKGKAVKVEYI